jgi:hypothetical protein
VTEAGGQSSQVLATALAIGIGLLISFSLGECGARLLSHTDEDGNVTLRSTRLRPYRVPLTRVRERVNELESRNDVCIAYDADLGWAPVPNSTCHEGMYRYNAQGIRTVDGRSVVAPYPAPGVRRIAIVGDSFTHGDDVRYEETWAHQLEQQLARSQPTEVIDLGVGGYGQDQALLRWRKIGAALHPSVVVFGFQVENAFRNLNLIRALYYWMTDLPFTKPRFVLEAGALRLINEPPVPPREIAATLAHIDEWEWVGFERNYDPADYRARWWQHSRLAEFVAQRLDWATSHSETAERAPYAPGAELGDLSARIVEQLASDVRAAGAEFRVVHLPRRQDLESLAQPGHRLDYSALLERVSATTSVVDPSPDMLADIASGTPIETLFTASNHYSQRGNQHVADALATAFAAH